jgi:long-chain acyl-CoA synthetase
MMVTVRTHLASLVEDFRLPADQTAVVAHRGNRAYRTSYGEVAQIAGRFAAELNRLKIAPGERVLFWGSNSAEWMGAFFGCLLRGVIAVPLDAAGLPEFAIRVVKDVRPALIVGDRNLLSHLLGHLPSEIPQLLLADLPTQLPAEADFSVSETVTSQTPFQIIFTSGTTSEPKGIVHTHRNVLASLDPIERELGKFRRYIKIVHPLRFLNTLPLSHVFGQFLGLWLPGLLVGEIHYTEQIEARRMAEMIHLERISVLVAVPRVIQLLRTHLLSRFDGLAERLDATKDRRKWTKWWTFREVHSALGWKFWAVISGGAALPTDLEEFWSGVGIPVIQGYGMTETTALVTLNYPFKIAQGSIGKPLSGREVRLSEEGEIQVRGDILATATWTGGKMQAREGDWLSTGDLGEKNERGELRFLGRKDDVIVTGGGMNVHPGDLETALKKQPLIRECAVVPCTLPSGTEPVAVVLLTGDASQLPQTVQAANQELATYQQIRRILVWPETQFPYTSTGKLLRRKVAEWVCKTLQNPAGLGLEETSATGKQSDLLLDLIAEVTGERALGSDDSLRLNEDLHLDSLGRVQLQSAIEQQLQMEFQDDILANLQTLGELRAILAASAPQLALPTTNLAPVAMPVSGMSPIGSVTQGAQPVGVAEPESASNLSAPATPVAKPRPSEGSQELRSLTSDSMYPLWPWNWFFAPIRTVFLETVMRPLVWLLGGPRVELTAAIPDGPLLIIANHVTAYDGALILYALPHKLRKRVAIAMLGEMLLEYRRGRNQGNLFLNFFAPPQYWLVTALFNVFPMPRANGFRKSFQHAGKAMDRGSSVMVFPEGARYFEGGIRPFRQGIGLLTQESQVPVLPVALIGLEEIHRIGMLRARLSGAKLLRIRIGEAIRFGEASRFGADAGANTGLDADPNAITAQLEDAVRKLVQQ